MAMDGRGSADFSVMMPLVKVWEDDAGELWFEGVASSTSLDRQQERMTANAIKKMGEQRGMGLLPSHSAGPLEELGVVDETWVDNDQFRVAGRLDKANPTALRLFDHISSGRTYGLSVGGRVRKAYWDYDEEAGRKVRHIDDVELDHVAVCRPEAAANPDTYLATIAKAAEQIAPEASGVADAPDEGDDVLLRIGKAAVNAARHIWPFGRPANDEGTMSGEERAPDEETAQVAHLRKELEEALVEVRKALGELMAAGDSLDGVVDPAKGETRALSGQETMASAAGDPWRGII